MIEETRTQSPTNEWDLLWKVLRVLLAAAPFIYLYLQARRGDIVSVIVLGIVLALVLIFLGGLAVLYILHRYQMWSDVRFRANAEENMAMLEQQAKLLSQQGLAQARSTRALSAQMQSVNRLLEEPEPEKPTVDISDIEWDADFDELAGL